MQARHIVVAGLLTFTTACGVGVETLAGEGLEASLEGEDGLSATSQSYVTLRPDLRKCMSPLCGGYYVADVNRVTLNEKYVSGLDFSLANLSPDDEDAVRSAPTGELLLRGKLGPLEAQFKTRQFRVTEAYRGMPGVQNAAGESFFRAQDRVPAINCFAAPCNNEVATRLNYAPTTSFTRLSVDRAALALVDKDWLARRVLAHGALVAGKFVNGAVFGAGPEKVLDASQVYLRVPDFAGPCPAVRLAQCPPGSTWTYTRSADRCLIPVGCVPQGICPLYVPSCAPGYQLASWRAAPSACARFACDPGFVAN